MTSFDESIDMSHDEDSGSFDHREKKHRTIFSAEQKSALEKMFVENPFPDKKQREELANRIGVNNPKSVDYWFGHRRAKNRHRMRGDGHFHTVPGSQSHMSDDGGDYFDDHAEVPDFYRERRHHSSSRHQDDEEEFNSIMFGNQSAYEKQSRKPAAPSLIKYAEKKRSATEAFQRPENAGLEQLWVTCLLNQFYLEPRSNQGSPQ